MFWRKSLSMKNSVSFSALGAVLMAALVVLLLFLLLQRPWQSLDTSGQTETSNNEVAPVAHSPQQAGLVNNVSQLRQYLADNPEDGSNWVFLARNLTGLERNLEAVEAYEKGHQLLGDKPDLLVEYAGALARENYEELQGEPVALLERALEIDPEHDYALWLAGTAAFQVKEFGKAAEYWERIVPRVDTFSEEHDRLRGMIAMVKYEARAMNSLGEPGSPAMRVQQEVRAIAGVKVRVSIAPHLADRVSPDDPVFIFAGEMDGEKQFSKEAIAKIRLKVSDLPTVVVLNDENSMKPTRNLSLFKSVRLWAYVTKVGRYKLYNGDLQGKLAEARLARDEPVELVLDQQFIK